MTPLNAMSKIVVCAFSFIILLPSLSSAQNNVSDGLALMKIDHAARSAGMGEAFTAISGDPNSSSTNPATSVGLRKFEVSFGHTIYWENVRLESVFMGKPLKDKLFWHLGFKMASIDNLELRKSKTALPDGIFEARDFSLKTGFSYMLNDKTSIGFSAGWFFEKIEAWRGSAFNIDLGATSKINEKLNIGASILNLGSDFVIEKSGIVGSDDIALPTTYRLGATYQATKLLFASDIVYLDDKAHLHLGAEKELQESFKLRTGYMLGYDTKNFTAGASFVHRNLTVDYAFVPYSQSLGTSHIFNLNFSL